MHIKFSYLSKVSQKINTLSTYVIKIRKDVTKLTFQTNINTTFCNFLPKNYMLSSYHLNWADKTLRSFFLVFGSYIQIEQVTLRKYNAPKATQWYIVDFVHSLPGLLLLLHIIMRLCGVITQHV